ncbi:type VI secretion system baseplate subunit TssK [Thalassoglobus sp. JC818]|uniref:type VI secretion system baseplate subunit TssK n=1 Tax=Thalassoglobus sp. JC818 TaxID=3232136 RepID=UPI003458B361
MSSHSIHWGEGVFLRPQHFQLADQLQREALSMSCRWENAYHYGIHHLVIDRDSLANWRVSISECQVRLPDGTSVRMPEDSHLAAEAIPRDALPNAEARVKVYVGIREIRRGANNAEGDGPDVESRYLKRETEVADENSAGNVEQIGVRVLNPRILIGDEAARGYDAVPIMQLKLGAAAESPPEIDPDYIPPTITTESSSQISYILRSICDQLGAESQQLSQQIRDRGVAFSSGHREDLEMISRLQAVNASLGGIAHLPTSRGLHPFHVYSELCRAAGITAIFRGNRSYPQIPAYDHDNLILSFQFLFQLLSTGEKKERSYVREPFRAQGLLMMVRLNPEWLQPDWRFYIGVECDLPTANVSELLSERALGMKVGSTDDVDQIYKMGRKGVRIAPVADPPRLFPRANWHYYRVERDTVWADVERTLNLGIRFNEKFVESQIAGEDRIDVLNRDTNENKTMAFSLFAMRHVES